MEFKIPFTISSLDRLKKRAQYFKKYIRYRKDSRLQKYLENCDVTITREEYLSICLKGFFISLLVLFLLSSTILVLLSISKAILFSSGLSVVFSSFILFTRIIYPKIFSARKEREIERNLISALQDILVQLNSGVPLFSIMVNISSSDYGALSKEFKKVVKKINAGLPQIDVLEEIGEKNPSIYFRRTLWQISNGLRAGSDISIIIRENIKTLNEEQLIQLQNYGNKLNPLVMFYMLISIIIPALSITFLTVVSSLVNLNSFLTTLMFIALFVFVILIQIMFLGIIKSARPNLL
ncbi:type II secretion system F family protein [Candidatus Pacearchaeota archaeon]|nr:type II secretion system F family protein [Candidatus Pacearchaeota archaeon]